MPSVRVGEVRDSRICMLDKIIKTRKKQVMPDHNSVESRNHFTRKRLLSLENPSSDFGFTSRKGPRKNTIKLEWEPPFRKGSMDNLLVIWMNFVTQSYKIAQPLFQSNHSYYHILVL